MQPPLLGLLGKLEVVKQEMARVNVDILGISKLKWTGMGEFNSDDHYINYCGQESLNGQQKSLKCSTQMQSPKQQNDLCSFPRQTYQYHGNQVYAPISKAEEAEGEWFYEDLQPSRTNIQKRCPFHYKGLEYKSRKSRNTWSKRQIWPWSTE